MNKDDVTEIFQYHEDTKHHYHRFARSPGYMDWENQPDPFRFYSGESPLALPFLKKDPVAAHLDLYRRGKNDPQAFNRGTIAGFLELSLGLSAWKAAAGSKWSLRINPSSGNLHPTEAYLIVPEVRSIRSGIYHYNSFLHALEPRSFLPDDTWQRLRVHFKTEGFLVALSSIFWRESWKYGERAYRYCHHDVGHAIACLSFAANLFGWKIKFLNGLSDRQVETLLGFDKTAYFSFEEEHPDAMCFVCGNDSGDVPRGIPDNILSSWNALSFLGKPNRLSREPVNWEVIYRTAERSRKPKTVEKTYNYGDSEFVAGDASDYTAAQIIRKRRSAVDFSPQGFIAKEQFFAILDKTIPRNNCAPFDVEIIEPCMDLLIFVHGVNGLAQGLYFFFRTEKHLRKLKRLFKPHFAWQLIEDSLPFYLLEEKDYRQGAKIVSCDQAIAGNSAFSLGMIARFEAVLEQAPYRYRHLFWEAGMIGQILYLEAEACGMRGTGIGCFFDDEVHDILGVRTKEYQSLYHFTIGEPIEDPRLKTFSPYHHIENTTR